MGLDSWKSFTKVLYRSR